MKNESTELFSAAEKAAMKARAKELKEEAKRAATREEGEAAIQAVLAELPEESRALGAKLHKLISASAPELSPRTWYGMPAYSNAEGKVVLFFRPAEKFKERYLTFGFNESAALDDGNMWPIAFAIHDLGPAEEARISLLVKRAIG